MNTEQFNGLIALKAVAEHRSFTEAADILEISPSAVSQSVKSLEKRLGVTLLTRTTRSTHLTEAGEKFLSEALPSINNLLQAMNQVGQYGNSPSGKLKINLPRIVYAKILEPVIASFLNKFPDISLELFFQDEVTDVVEGGFDCGIRLTELTAKDMIAIKIFGTINHIVVASPKYLKENGTPKHPKDLINHHCNVFRFGKLGVYDRWEFEDKNNEFQVQVKAKLTTNDPIALRDSALSGIGLSYYIEELIQDELKDGRLVKVLEKYSTKGDGFYLYYPEGLKISTKLRVFIDHLKENLKHK